MKRSKVMALRALIEKAAASLDDGDALEAVELLEKFWHIKLKLIFFWYSAFQFIILP